MQCSNAMQTFNYLLSKMEGRIINEAWFGGQVFLINNISWIEFFILLTCLALMQNELIEKNCGD